MTKAMDPLFEIVKNTFTSLNDFVNEVQEVGWLEKNNLTFELHPIKIDAGAFMSYAKSFKKLCSNLQGILKELDSTVSMSSKAISVDQYEEPTTQDEANPFYFKDNEYKSKKQKEIDNKIEIQANKISHANAPVPLNHLSGQVSEHQNMQYHQFDQDILCPPSNLVIPFQNLAIDSVVEEPSLNGLLGNNNPILMQSYSPSVCLIESVSGGEQIEFEQGKNFGSDVNIGMSSNLSSAENNNYVVVSSENLDLGSADISDKRTWGTKARSSHRCVVCSRLFRTQKHLTVHMNKSHPCYDEELVTSVGPALPLYSCATCHSTTNDYATFRTHTCRPSEHTHSSSSKRSLISNLKVLDQQKKFICEACGVEFRSFQRISYHLPRCHPGPYPCDTCSTNFVTRKQLNYHKKKEHKDEKCFICEECGKKFMRKSSLRKHCVSRHESKALIDSSKGGAAVSYECDACAKKFIKKIFLTNHKLRMHGLDKMFVCEVCDRKFLTNSSLVLHMDIHKEEKKFGCQFCDKRFRRKEKMLLHERIHTGERPFECGRCGKSFVSNARLNEHVRRHDAEKRFPCPHCDKTYAAAFDLKKHTLRKHNLVMRSQCVKVTLKRLVGVKNSTAEQIVGNPVKSKEHPILHQLTSSSLTGLVDGILQSPPDSRQNSNTLHQLPQVSQILTDSEAAPTGVAIEMNGEHLTNFADPLTDQSPNIVISQSVPRSQIVYHQPLQEYSNP